MLIPTYTHYTSINNKTIKSIIKIGYIETKLGCCILLLLYIVIQKWIKINNY